jgi:hypothetical protein
VRRLLPLVLALCALAGCTSSGSSTGPTSPTITRTQTLTRTPTAAPTFTPAPAATVQPLAPGQQPGQGEVDKTCPYIRPGLNQDSGGGVNVADIEGDRVYRTTVLNRLKPAGCRFYFYAPPYEAVADIQPRLFATATAAHNALVLTAQAGTEQISEPNFVPGVDGICYRTKFFGADGQQDWAFAFAKGKLLVVVHTQRKDTSRNAFYLGKAIVGEF